MNKILMLDTSISSSNRGDDIIMDCCSKELRKILENNFVVNIPTHSYVQLWRHSISIMCSKSVFYKFDYKFLCGTNALSANQKSLNISRKPICKPNWTLGILSPSFLKGTVCVGVGRAGYAKVGLYTKMVYKKYLNQELIHSARDERTAEYLRSIGLKAINTSCVTLWSIDQKLCDFIAKKKSDSVVFTLTDYCKEPELDRKLIKILKSNYSQIYFWIQGQNDYDYLKSLTDIHTITLIGPSLKQYDSFLETHDCDYVGTRLHAGIRAIQHKHRSVILSVDNRAKDMKETSGLCILERDNICELDNIINGDIIIRPHSNATNVKIFLEQFDFLRKNLNE